MNTASHSTTLPGELNSDQLDDFLSALRHDLKAPLVAIKGYVDLMRRGIAGPLTPRMERYLEEVIRATQRECDIIDSRLTRSEDLRRASPNPPPSTPSARLRDGADGPDSPQ